MVNSSPGKNPIRAESFGMPGQAQMHSIAALLRIQLMDYSHSAVRQKENSPGFVAEPRLSLQFYLECCQWQLECRRQQQSYARSRAKDRLNSAFNLSRQP